ncbi:MAG: plastocyanin/azurin family copper-binding protein [Gemmatimonadota bacterium]
MRFSGLALVAAVATLSACGGGEKPAADANQAAAPAAAAAAAAAVPVGGVAAMAATGKTHEVKMVGDEKGYRFEPAELTIKVGDAVKFTVISAVPHNVAFTAVPADSRAQLQANMPEAMGDMMGKMLMAANDAYTISFAGVKPGKYEFNCTPHLANNMKGTITVQ